MKINTMLRLAFVLGAVVDGAIALSWFLIASGVDLPNILNGYVGAGADYRLAMYCAAMFMAGWSVLLAWGACKPSERRDLLLITAGFLVLSVVVELVLFRTMLGGAGFWFGVTKRLLLSVFFLLVYFRSPK